MRRIVKKILMMGFIVCMFMVFGFLSTASAVPYSVTRMSNNDRDDYNVRISNNGDMVWVGPGAGGNSAIYVYDATINLTRLLTNDSYYSENPQINANGDIVWREFSPVELDYNIMLYTKATNTIKRISLPKDPNFPHYDTNPQINNLGQVVYQSQNNGSDYEIMFYDGAMVTQVTDNDLIDEFPMLNDSGDIVWMASVVNTGTSDIFLYDGGSKAITRITNTTANHIIPRINNAGDIVFSGWDGAHYQIYYYKRSTGITIKVTNSTCDNIMVQINAGGQMAWEQVCAADSEVIFRNGLPGTNINICNNPTSDDYGPQINDNGWVTWFRDMGNTGTNDQILVWDGTAVTQLTNNAYDNINPVINNWNEIAWLGNSGPGTDYELFRAITGPCAILNCNDNNLCTTDSCDLATGTCVHTPINCNDNDACTADSCDPATGCVHTPIVPASCNDNDACTSDGCTANTCTHTPIVCNDNNRCTVDSCNPATGCVYTLIFCSDNNACTIDTCNTATGCVYPINETLCTPSPAGNNFTMLDTGGNLVGGTNDVVWAWDGTRKTSVAVSGQISNALLTSTCPFGGVSWSAHDVTVYGPGTYTVYADCPAGSPGCGTGTPITFTVKTGEIGIHMLFNWNDNNDIDVVNVLKPNAFFAPSPMWTYGCGSNAACTVWDWMSYDYNGDGINGGRMVDGPFPGFSPNFNFIKGVENPCCDADTRCNDNNVCTDDSCDPATGICIHINNTAPCNDNNLCTVNDVCSNGTCKGTPKCDDHNACTIDTCDPSTGACVNTPITTDDHNACTTDSCNPITGQIIHAPINCDDNNVCTTDSCNTSTGCVHTNNTLSCSDGNACTLNDVCSAGTCVAGTPRVCLSGHSCTPAVGCIPANSTGNNFTLLASNGYTMGGTNDVKFTWDGTLQNATTFANGTGPSNATISSDEPLDGWLWHVKHVQIVGPGTYWVGLGNGGPSANRYEVTIPTGQIGAHMLMDWGPTGQATSCGKTNCNIDVWVAWKTGSVFPLGKLFTGADDGTNNNQPQDGTTSLLDGRSNAGTKVWDLASVDLAGRITTPTGTTVINLPLDGIPGIKIMQGDYYGSNVNFNLMLEDPCADAATRCNDNNACTNDLCDQATGACSHTTVVCDDGNLCTVDTCNTTTGCVFAPKNSNDNNPCTDDYCNMQGNIIHPAHNCDDNNVCTTDTCNTATGCVHTNNTVACTDNNACTVNDLCSGGVCVPGTPKVCTDGSACNPARGCIPIANTSGNNMTIFMPTGLIYGGTNDVKFTWDGTIQNATTFANGTGPSNATITSDEPLDSWLWYIRKVQIVGPGTYWVPLSSGYRYEATIPAGRIGAHMLMDWGPTGQATSCGKTDCDVDVWVVWDFNDAFMTGKLFIGADDGTNTNAPALDVPTVNSLLDGQPNTGTKVWNLVSVDFTGRVITQSGAQILNLPVDNVPGIRVQEGNFKVMNINFNMMVQ